MRRRLLIICFAVMTGALSSCITEVDEVFDTTSSERLQASLTECQQLLTSAGNGWLIQYYPSANREFGGYNFVAKFAADGYVEMSGDVADDITTTVKSHYSLLTSNSVTLSFDTYNSYLHYWSDPDLWSDNKFGGDYEWAYVSGDQNEMIFRGVKTGNIILFTALEENMITYLQKISVLQSKIHNSVFAYFSWNDGTSDELTFYYDDGYPVLSYYPDSNNPDTSTNVAYTYTSTGICLYEPITVNGITVQNFTWDETGIKLVSTGAVNESTGAAADVSLDGAGYVAYDKFIGAWTLKYGTFSTTVRLTQKTLNESFTMTGLPYNVEVGFNNKRSTLSMVYQYLGMYNSTYYIYLCPTDGSYLYFADGSGFNLAHKGDESNLVLTFEDNGVIGGLTGFFMYAFTSSTPSSSGMVGWLYDYNNVVTMTKN